MLYPKDKRKDGTDRTGAEENEPEAKGVYGMNTKELSREVLCKAMMVGCAVLVTYPFLVRLIIYVAYVFSGR